MTETPDTGAGADGETAGAASAEPRARHRAPARRPRTPASTPAADAEAAAEPAFDLRSPDLYLNRELTWLAFNRRVLHEAEDPRTPLLERVKFLAITAANTDEFFMKRIGGLKQQIGAGVQKLTVDGRTPGQQLEACYAVLADFRKQKRAVYVKLIAELRRHDIRVHPFSRLPQAKQAAVREHYYRNVFPLVTPLAMDPAHPFPFISNLSLNLLVTLRFPDEPELTMARVKVPVGADVPRFLRVGEANHFVMLEDVMAHCLEDLFPGMEIETVEVFRVTRNANTERDEEKADDLLAMIESELRERKFAPIVRLQTAKGINPTHRGMLAAELGLDEATEVYDTDVMVGMRDLMEIAQIDIPELHYPTHQAINNGALRDRGSIFHILREHGPILLQHPYESFGTSVVRFVREAAEDPKVLAIKMTLYRTSADSKIIDYLVEAALNGKQVAVVVELKARFDEAANIQWASRMEEAGIHVTYGVIGLKTHSKSILVVRRDYNGLRRYAHVGTGNYHAGTARQYCDLGLLTTDEAIGLDLTELFNYLTTGCRPARNYRKILAAPKMMKKALLAKIEREIAVHAAGKAGRIRFKCNALEDPDIVEALYRASQAGVTVDLVIRDTCRLRPGIAGLSETIRVVSVVGRFLEHARVYYFRNGGDEEYYVGSADLMTRNLEHRVELLAPIELPAHRRELRQIFEVQLADRRGGWHMVADGTYALPSPATEDPPSSQAVLIDAADKRDDIARGLRKDKPRPFARRGPK